MLPFEAYQRFTVQDTIGAAEASKTLLDVGAGVTIVVTGLAATVIISAAQAVYVGDTSGAVKALSLAASVPAHSRFTLELKNGLRLTEGEDLIIKPGAAGPSLHVVVEGYLLKSNVNLGA